MTEACGAPAGAGAAGAGGLQIETALQGTRRQRLQGFTGCADM